jgi:hypothetical protein
VEQREDQQAVVGGCDAEPRPGHVRHRREIGVVEHHALGLAGRAAGVDQQRKRVGLDGGGISARRRLFGERGGLDHGGVEREPVADHELGARVVDLELHLGRR